jgi:rSAM/selenodomain-associated transferase 2
LTISIIIPTYNEEVAIAGLLEQLTRLCPHEILVADGGSTDGTVELARRYARVIAAPIGRGAQMNEAARQATGDALLFLHADVRVCERMLVAAQKALADGAVVGGNFDICYDGDDWTARVFTWVNRARCRCGVIYGDSGIFCRRSIFEGLGGYPPWPILEDYSFARQLHRAGKVALLPTPIHVSARRWRRAGLFATLWSWFWIQALFLAGVRPERLARMYRNVR